MSPKDQEKIGKTYSEEREKLLGYIRKRVPQEYEAEDILQDVFYQLTRGFKDLKRIQNLTSWIYTITNNRIIDGYRKKKLDTLAINTPSVEDENEPLSLEEILPDLGDTPDEKEIKELIWEEIEATLDALPIEQGEVFVMHEFEDMSFDEISKTTGIGVNTLISRKRYAVLALRNRLNHLYNQLKIK